MSLYLIAFSRFFSPVTSPSHFSNSHKIVPSTTSYIKFGSLTMPCKKKCLLLFVFSCCFCLLIIVLDSIPIHHLLATVVLQICHILSSATSFPAKTVLSYLIIPHIMVRTFNYPCYCLCIFSNFTTAFMKWAQ